LMVGRLDWSPFAALKMMERTRRLFSPLRALFGDAFDEAFFCPLAEAFFPLMLVAFLYLSLFVGVRETPGDRMVLPPILLGHLHNCSSSRPSSPPSARTPPLFALFITGTKALFFSLMQITLLDFPYDCSVHAQRPFGSEKPCTSSAQTSFHPLTASHPFLQILLRPSPPNGRHPPQGEIAF